MKDTHADSSLNFHYLLHEIMHYLQLHNTTSHIMIYNAIPVLIICKAMAKIAVPLTGMFPWKPNPKNDQLSWTFN